ncbi:hypothetical protein PRK78_004005 [Emydomyces testavorans]|uniref:Uncharacterized protein n=1 Tax=Emydomyces testavorans TaxID=2070801 RepID=A0AAF0DJ43_9EURO|nr:hypothetical protein PRK78_004005 [Emydomyces testavorans]
MEHRLNTSNRCKVLGTPYGDSDPKPSLHAACLQQSPVARVRMELLDNKAQWERMLAAVSPHLLQNGPGFLGWIHVALYLNDAGLRQRKSDFAAVVPNPLFRLA